MQMSGDSNQNEHMIQSAKPQSRASGNFNINIESSHVSNKGQSIVPAFEPEVQGTELSIDRLSLTFDTELNNSQVKELKVRNVGESAVYFEWV